MVVVIIISDAKRQPMKQAVSGADGGAMTLQLLWKPFCLEMESGGKQEEARRKESAE